MKQQINLYQEQFFEKIVPYSFKQVFMVSTMITVFIVCISGVLMWLNYQDRIKHLHLNRQKNPLMTEIVDLKNVLEAQVVSDTLAKAVQEANYQMEAKRQVLELIKEPLNEEKYKFSDLLAGLARQHVRGMWLVHIDIDDRGDHLLFKGSTLDPKLIPEFISKLNREPVYSGRQFETMMMYREGKGLSKIEFILSTTRIDESKLFAQKDSS